MKQQIKRIKTEIEKQKTKKKIMYFICQEREKQKKNNHHTPSHTKPRGRGYGGVSKKIIEGQV